MNSSPVKQIGPSDSITEVARDAQTLMTPTPEKKKSKYPFTGFGASMLMILAFALFFYANFKSVVVSGPSMLPTFKSGTRVLVSKAYWLVGAIKPKDIVVLKGEGGEHIIKRVYRLEGQAVDLYNVPKTWSLLSGEYVVPKGSVYVLGDNRAVSEDSRAFGPVPVEKIVGKVIVRP